jgi:hypothetical protein
MTFVNSEELAKHKSAVHIGKMFQCQSCNKIFDSKQDFQTHAIDMHGELRSES